MYGGIVVVILLVLIAIPAWKLFYNAPSCFDSVQNGKEQGVDCGGKCVKLCQSEFLAPVVDWTRFEEVANGLYNVAAYIENLNTDAEATDVPYRMQLYDDRGIIITEYYGTLTLPPHRNTLAFQGAVGVKQRVPAKALFEFIATPEWNKQNDTLSKLIITDKRYEEDETGGTLSAELKNTGVEPIGRMSVYAVLYDEDGNALGFSKTVIDGIDAGAAVTAPFTWPRSRDGAVVSIEILPVTE